MTEQVSALRPDLLVTNELPFGRWLASDGVYDSALAARSVEEHASGCLALSKLGLPAVLTSTPCPSGNRLANEACLLEGSVTRFVHQKHYFPSEPYFHENIWFQATRPGFDVAEVNGLRVGALLCTELMFNEWARHYRRQHAVLLAVPRATGITHEGWKIAAAMAAIVSGCYVISSNRVGEVADGFRFGGCGFAFGPTGVLLAETDVSHPVQAIDLDLAAVRAAQDGYPCYVAELP